MALCLTRALLTSALPKGNPTTAATPTVNTHPKTKMKTTTLEVERKFRRLTLPTLTNIYTNLMTTNDFNHHHRMLILKGPMFELVHNLPTRQIHDIYYDTPAHTLCAAGAWIRKRDGEWEAKINRAGWGGDFVNSRFEEVIGKEAVRGCVEKILGGHGNAIIGKGGEGCGNGVAVADDDNLGLEILAEFVTTREAWVVDEEFKVVRDKMDFGHEVGEVELQKVFARGMGEEEKGAVMEEMDQRIERFMEKYAWAWERGGAVGKLTAYFEMVKRRGGRGL